MYWVERTVEVNNVTPKLEQKYQKVVFEGLKEGDKGKSVGGTAEELLAQCVAFFKEKETSGTDAEKEEQAVIYILGRVTYAYDLDVRNGVRTELTSGGPEKAIEKQIKIHMAAREKAGKPISYELARKRVLMLMEMEDETAPATA